MNISILAIVLAAGSLLISTNAKSLSTITDKITTVEKGSLNTLDYRIYFRNSNGYISPFHDIPLFADDSKQIFNMVVEIPRWTNAKMEVDTKDFLTPIKQDVRKGQLRYVQNCFPHHGYIWNYGTLPQTWESPNYPDEFIGMGGDNDPIDVCEIGSRIAKSGDVIQVKILGILGLLDGGETDWKLIAIDVRDPMADELNNINDVHDHFPGLINATVYWYTTCRYPSENEFAFGAEAKDKEFALTVLNQTHYKWMSLIDGTDDPNKLNIRSATVPNAKELIDQGEAEEIVSQNPKLEPPTPIDPKIDEWYYVIFS